MDELKLIISTKFMRNIITKILAKVIYKKTGYRVDIQINRVEADMDADAEINSEDLMHALRTSGLL